MSIISLTFSLSVLVRFLLTNAYTLFAKQKPYFMNFRQTWRGNRLDKPVFLIVTPLKNGKYSVKKEEYCKQSGLKWYACSVNCQANLALVLVVVVLVFSSLPKNISCANECLSWELHGNPRPHSLHACCTCFELLFTSDPISLSFFRSCLPSFVDVIFSDFTWLLLTQTRRTRVQTQTVSRQLLRLFS